MHDRLAPAGRIGQTIVEAGGRTTVLMPHERHGSLPPHEPVGLPATGRDFDALLILGGAMHAADDRGFPHFERLLELIRRFHRLGKPVLGICLGAQLVGRAFGAPVRRQGFLEFGFEPVRLGEAARRDPLLAGLGPEVRVMQWHEDTVALPQGALHLAASEACTNQIFRVGRTTYGFQCHIEVTPDIARSWVRHRAPEIAADAPWFFERFEADLDQYMKPALAFCRMVTRRWLDLCRLEAQGQESAEPVSEFTDPRGPRG
ncbi:MAG TPA: type 1 glutamine amidotransferase [Geminicoccaceae bacterium]